MPAAIGSALRAAQSSPPTLTRPVPMRRSMSCVTMPCRPISGSVRDGTPGPPSRPIEARAEQHRARRHHDDEQRRTAPDAEAKQRHGRRRDGAEADEDEPKCGIETSMIAATKATTSQPSAVASKRPHRRESADYSRSGTAAARRPFPATACRAASATVAMPKQIEQPRPLRRRRLAPCGRARGRRAREPPRRTSRRCARRPRTAAPGSLIASPKSRNRLAMFGLDHEIEQQTEQHLDVERHHRDQAPAIGERTAALRPCRGRRRASRRRRRSARSSASRNEGSGAVVYMSADVSTTGRQVGPVSVEVG